MPRWHGTTYAPENYAGSNGYAHGIVRLAIREGRMPPPETQCCEACGRGASELKPPRQQKSPIVYHHWSTDPAHALDVMPLCRSCHSFIHHGRLAEPRTGRIYARGRVWPEANPRRLAS